MRIGVNLPQYAIDFSESARASQTVLELAHVAEERGLDDVWLSDHPFVLGPDGVISGALEPLVMMSAISRRTDRIGLGTLVLASTMRAPGLVGHMTRTLPASRLTVGAGGGWYRPEHDAFGLELPRLDERMRLLDATLQAAHAAGARTLAGGIGDAAIEVAARAADVWNAAWDPPVDAYRARSRALDHACARAGRKAAEVSRSVGVNVLVAHDEEGLERAAARLRARAPFLQGVDLRVLKERIICGAPDECAARIASYEADEVVVTLALRDDAEMLALFADHVAPKLR